MGNLIVNLIVAVSCLLIGAVFAPLFSKFFVIIWNKLNTYLDKLSTKKDE